MEKQKKTKICPRCKGDERVRRAIKKCPGCNARGVQIIDGVSKTCFECGGERFLYGYVACNVCDATGEVPLGFDLNRYVSDINKTW